MPRTLRRIGGCESSGHGPTGTINWTAQNAHSTASGGFQILDTTWKGWAFSYGQDVGATQYARAMHAPPSVQLTVARRAFERQGTGPWSESRNCWAG